MAIYQGKLGDLKIETEGVAETTSWSCSIDNETFDRKVFGSLGWRETISVGQSWDATCEGFLDLADTEQLAFFNACISGTTISTVRFYVNETIYLDSNTSLDADATAIVENFSPGQDASGQATYSMSLKGNGPIRVNGL